MKYFNVLFSIFISLFSLRSVSSFAQSQLNGKVLDSKQQALSDATVSLKIKDSTKVFKYALTDSVGDFSFDVPNNNYILQISYIGLETNQKEIVLNGNINVSNIILLESKDKILQGVTIVDKKPLIVRKIDRLIFNVDQSIAATGGNALDALKVTPRIKVQNDQISMIGKSGMQVMVNDRLLQLSGEDLANYLKNISSSDIKSIEVIANPPAKYSAEGNSGIINIVTKKIKNNTWNTSVRSVYKQATYETGGWGGGFNLHKNKIAINTTLNYTNGSNAPQETNLIYYPNFIWDEKINRRDFTNVFSFKFGLEYKINKKINTGFTYNLTSSNPLSKSLDQTDFQSVQTNLLDSIISTISRDYSNKQILSLNYHVVYDMDTAGKKLSLDVDAFNFTNPTNNVFQTRSYFSDGKQKDNASINIRNYGNQKINNYSVNLDMEHPSSWINLNYGARISSIQSNNLFDYFDIKNQQEQLNINYSNVFDYREHTQAVYASAQKKISDQWEAKAGLRYEITRTKGYSETLNQSNGLFYKKIFPTFYLNYTPNDKHSFTVKKGRRIKRPTYSFLNPFRWTSNPYSYVEGNPFLQPAFIDNLEFEYNYKDHIITNFYYSHTDNDFKQIIIIDSKTNIQQYIPKNYILNNTYGINLIFIFKPFKFCSLQTSADIYYSASQSKIPITLQQLNGWNGEFNISNDFILNVKKTLFLNINYTYLTKGVDNVQYSSDAQFLDISLKCLLLNKKLTLSIYGSDVLRTGMIRHTGFSNGIKNSFLNYYDQKYFRISATYHFGKMFSITKRQGRNQEELGRAN